MQILQWVAWILSVPLQVLVLSCLIRGPYRKYPFVTIFVIVLILSTVIEVAGRFDNEYLSAAAKQYYWIDYSIKQLLLSSIVFGFIRRATRGTIHRDRVQRWLLIGAVVVSVISLFLHRKLNVDFLMTALARDLSFFSAVLNLILWSLLIRFHARDRQLLLVTGGLGVQFTAEAIGQSLRHLSPLTLSLGNIVLVSGSLLCLYVWWQAFRRPETGDGQPVPQG